jgi:hypothetical protein
VGTRSGCMQWERGARCGSLVGRECSYWLCRALYGKGQPEGRGANGFTALGVLIVICVLKVASCDERAGLYAWAGDSIAPGFRRGRRGSMDMQNANRKAAGYGGNIEGGINKLR